MPHLQLGSPQCRRSHPRGRSWLQRRHVRQVVQQVSSWSSRCYRWLCRGGAVVGRRHDNVVYGHAQIQPVSPVGNPTAAAIVHVLNNRREFPAAATIDDLLVMSISMGTSPAKSASSTAQRPTALSRHRCSGPPGVPRRPPRCPRRPPWASTAAPPCAQATAGERRRSAQAWVAVGECLCSD